MSICKHNVLYTCIHSSLSPSFLPTLTSPPSPLPLPFMPFPSCIHISAVFDEAKVCRFDGKHYCSMCSNSRERTIPGRVLFNWDFQKYSVCTQCCYFLDCVESEPFINMEEVNRSLYSYIPELDEAHVSHVRCM